MIKLHVYETVQRVVEQCVQYQGGHGFLEENWVSRVYRDVRLLTIGAGSSELMKDLIARYLRLYITMYRSRRVLITGLGVVSTAGTGQAFFWDAALIGRSAIQRITRFDPTSYPCQIGGEVTLGSYEELLDPRMLRTATHVTQLALAATELALRD